MLGQSPQEPWRGPSRSLTRPEGGPTNYHFFSHPVGKSWLSIFFSSHNTSHGRKTLTFVTPQSICFPTPEQIGLQKSDPSSKTADVPWHLWGPANSRWFKLWEFNKWSRNVHGFKFISPERVYDFNQLSISRDIAYGQTEGFVHHPTIIPAAEEIFDSDLVSSLPYRTTNIPSTAPFHRAGLLADDYILEMKVGD